MAMRSPSLRGPAVIGVGALFLGTLAIAPAGAASTSANNNTSAKLRAAVTAAGMSEHLMALQTIADGNNGHRFAGTAGHDDSASYAEAVFEAAGLNVTTQEFVYQTFIQVSAPILEQVAPGARGSDRQQHPELLRQR